MAVASVRRFGKLIGIWLIAVGVVIGASWLGLERALVAIGPLPLAGAGDLSTAVLDRNGGLLRAFTTKDGRWRLDMSHGDANPRYLDLLFAFEDRRFYRHGGVDALAMLRAGGQFVRHGRIISGGSTLTMQVARLLEGPHERSASAKLRQMLRAIQLERRYSKTDILDLYLRLAPFGGNIEGVRAASLAYFGREPQRLSVGEAALLVALPQSPEARRPDRNWKAAKAARARVLERGVAAGVISQAEAERAKQERLPKQRLAFPKLAPHLAESEVARAGDKTSIVLTLDASLQGRLERLARRHVKALGPQLSAAIIVVEHASGQVLAHVGSAGYFDHERFGAIDMVAAVRSPGSTLKPVIYGLAFDMGLAHPLTLIEDRPTRFGTYRPKNFDNSFRGTVTVREALARSLNIPAVKALEAVGPGRLLGRLEKAGITTVLPPSTEPSLSVALGGIGIRLRDLAALYAAIARGGSPVTLVHRQQSALRSAKQDNRLKRLLSESAAFHLTDILKDAPPPPNARGGRIAYKTGTSYGYRDAWAVGYDGRHTVAVWVGRPDMVSTPGLLGRTAAAPMLFDAFARISHRRAPLSAAPASALRVRSGDQLPPPLKRFEKVFSASLAGPYINSPLAIAFPPDRSEVELAGRRAPVLLKAEGGALPLTWMIDGSPVGVSRHRRKLVWQPRGEGFARVSVIDAKGQVDRVTVRLKAP